MGWDNHPNLGQGLHDPVSRAEAAVEDSLELVRQGRYEDAMAARATELGLKEPEGAFYHMSRQHDPDLQRLAWPVTSLHPSYNSAHAKAVAAVLNNAGMTEDQTIRARDDLRESKVLADQGGATVASNQAEAALDEVSGLTRKDQGESAVRQVGGYTVNSGWVAARSGDGDLIVALSSEQTLKALEEAGYKPTGDIGVPFNNNADTYAKLIAA